MILALPWIPIFAAFVVLFIPKNESLVKAIAAFSTGLCLALTLFFFFNFDPKAAGFQFAQSCEWLPALGIHYSVGFDGINLTLCLLLGLISFAGVFVCCGIKDRLNKYLFFYLLLAGALYGALTATDLFMMYLSYELTLIPLYAAIGIWGTGDKSGNAMKTALFLATGALVGFFGLLLLYRETGLNTFDFEQIRRHLQSNPLSADFQKTAAGLLLVGFGTLTSMFPLHSWAPAGYASAPASFSMLHGGVKVGPYLLLRLAVSLLPAGVLAWSHTLAILAVITILHAGYAAMRQHDLKSMIGFSTVSHMGYVLLGIAAMTSTSLSAVVFLIFSHGLVTAASFAVTGYLEAKTGTTGIRDFGGLGKQAPFISICFILVSLASLGLPGFASFAAELMVFTGSWQRFPLKTGLAIFGVLITSIYLLRAVQHVCYGQPSMRWANLSDSKCWFSKLPFIILLGALLVFGIWPQGILNIIRPAVDTMLAGGVS